MTFRDALRGALPVMISAAMAPGLAGQSIRGILLEAHSDRALADGSVVLLSPEGNQVRLAVTDAEGAFTMIAPAPGPYDLYVERLGYLTSVTRLDLVRGEEVLVQFRLEPSAFALDSIGVSVPRGSTALQRVGFDTRRQRGIGHFLTRDRLLERGPQRDLPDVLRVLTGVHTEPSRFGPDRILLRRVGTPLDPRPYCEPYLFLDGLPVQPPWEDMVDLDEVQAVEVYPDPGRVPAIFASRAQQCGVVVVWSRSRYGGG